LLCGRGEERARADEAGAAQGSEDGGSVRLAPAEIEVGDDGERLAWASGTVGVGLVFRNAPMAASVFRM
jgi:hypothetical protein